MAVTINFPDAVQNTSQSCKFRPVVFLLDFCTEPDQIFFYQVPVYILAGLYLRIFFSR